MSETNEPWFGMSAALTETGVFPYDRGVGSVEVDSGRIIWRRRSSGLLSLLKPRLVTIELPNDVLIERSEVWYQRGKRTFRAKGVRIETSDKIYTLRAGRGARLESNVEMTDRLYRNLISVTSGRLR
ncbi:MAG: hypothetical protein AB7P33_16140 [Dehalococcoidia bacterium]